MIDRFFWWFFEIFFGSGGDFYLGKVFLGGGRW